MNNTNEIIELWKKNKVDYVNFEFSCGGDSMNDTSIQIYDKAGSEIQCSEISDYIDNEVYNRVEFYVNSDGHYQGEAGNVTIRLNDEGDDFEYSKIAESEWSERVTNYVDIEFSEKEIQFIKEKVFNINGGEGEFSINYKGDCILSDEEEKMVEEIEEKIQDEVSDYCPDVVEGEVGEWYSFTTNNEGEEIKIKGNSLVVEVNNEVTVFRDSDD